MSDDIPIERLAWAIGARERSQRLLLALYGFGKEKGYGSPESEEARVFSVLVAVAFSLWRAAFLADAPTRTWPEALDDVQEFLKTALRTNAIAFSTEHARQGWTAGYYLKNALLRLQDVLQSRVESGHALAEDVARVRRISLMWTDPHDTWTRLCVEAEQLAQQIGCRLR
jgi:hypothetical protein